MEHQTIRMHEIFFNLIEYAFCQRRSVQMFMLNSIGNLREAGGKKTQKRFSMILGFPSKQTS